MSRKALVVGVGDDQGYGFAICKALAEAGYTIYVGTWAPILSIFTTALRLGKYDDSRKLSTGSLLEFAGIFPIDASFDTEADIPEEIREHKRYKDVSNYSVEAFAKRIEVEVGKIDVVVHSLANAPEVKNPLLETSRKGYLAAVSASSYSFVSLCRYLGPLVRQGGSFLNLTYMASIRCIPGYGGGMSSAKAALESDTRTLAWEMGRKWKIRVNTLSAGPLGSRAAKAIGFIDKMIAYSESNSPLSKPLFAHEVAHAAAFLCSDGASAITGTTLFVDNGLHAMGLASDSQSMNEESQSLQECTL